MTRNFKIAGRDYCFNCALLNDYLLRKREERKRDKKIKKMIEKEFKKLDKKIEKLKPKTMGRLRVRYEK